MLVVEWLTTNEPQLPPIVIFALTALAGFAIAARIYRGIGGGAIRGGPSVFRVEPTAGMTGAVHHG
jgi:hypothetical protein